MPGRAPLALSTAKTCHNDLPSAWGHTVKECVMTQFTTLFLPTVLLACSGKGGSDFEPKEGLWRQSHISVDDGCDLGLGDAELEDTFFQLSLSSNGKAFTLSADSIDTAQADSEGTCTLDDMSFSCVAAQGDTHTIDYTSSGLDAMLTMTNGMEGEFESETAGTLDSSLVMSCEGTQCDEIAQSMGPTELPCSFSSQATMTAE
jgi:hypothetical protein